MPYSIAIADDHVIFLNALEMLFKEERDFKVVGTAKNGMEILDLANSLKPDAIVLDIGMPHMNGIEATRKILAHNPNIKIVGLSGYSYQRYVLELLNAGACGYILKECAASDLMRGLRFVMSGRKYLCPEIAAGIIDNSGRYYMSDIPTLGSREREVLQLLAEGDTSPQIARRLFISASTVDVHRRNIMKKLDLHSVAELTKYAIRNGLTGI